MAFNMGTGYLNGAVPPKASAPVPVIGNGTVVNVEGVMQQISTALRGIGLQLGSLSDSVGRIESGLAAANGSTHLPPATLPPPRDEFVDGKGKGKGKSDGYGKSTFTIGDLDVQTDRARGSVPLPPPPPSKRSSPY